MARIEVTKGPEDQYAVKTIETKEDITGKPFEMYTKTEIVTLEQLETWRAGFQSMVDEYQEKIDTAKELV